MATDATAADSAARAFAEELDVKGEAFSEAINAPDFQVELENKLRVPKAMKKAWQKWCLKGHPDKGGDSEDFLAMKIRYEKFKGWFQAYRDEPTNRQLIKVQERAQAKTVGDKSLEEGRKALEGRQYEDAKVFAEEAIIAYEAFKKLLHNMQDVDETEEKVAEAKALLTKAEEHIQQLEFERKQRETQREEYEELHRGLNNLFHSCQLCSTVEVVGKRLAIPQKFGELRKSFDANKARIIALERDDTEKQIKIERLEQENLKLQDKCTYLEKEEREAMEEASGAKGVFHSLVKFFTSGSSKGSMKSMIKQMCAEKEREESELREMQTKLTAKDGDVDLERAKARNLQEKVAELQVALERERLKHHAELQRQSAQTAQRTHLSSEAQHTRGAEHVATDAVGQEASTINDSSVSEVTESQLTKIKRLEAIELERDSFRAKTESLQKEVDELRNTIVTIVQIGMNMMPIGQGASDKSCLSGASTQADSKTEV